MSRKSIPATQVNQDTSAQNNNKAKTMQPEQTFKRSFTPLTSKKDGTARLTLAGYKHSVTNDGKRPFFKIVLTCMDVTRENPANIGVLTSYNYNETNILGKLLKVLGYVDGNNEIVLDPDDEEFGYKLTNDYLDIYGFLDTNRGLVFKGVITQGEDGFYDIEVESLQPLLNKEGRQQRDYMADEGLSEKEIAIDIEANGGDDN